MAFTRQREETSALPREFSSRKHHYVPVVLPDLRADIHTLAQTLTMARPGKNNLLAYPAQSNSTGVQHPLEWIEQAQSQGWDVLLDAASFTPTNRLDLSRWHPDFVDIAFYKIFCRCIQICGFCGEFHRSSS